MENNQNQNYVQISHIWYVSWCDTFEREMTFKSESDAREFARVIEKNSAVSCVEIHEEIKTYIERKIK